MCSTSPYFSEDEELVAGLVAGAGLLDAGAVAALAAVAAGVLAGAGVAGAAGGVAGSFFSPLPVSFFSPSVGGFILSE